MFKEIQLFLCGIDYFKIFTIISPFLAAFLSVKWALEKNYKEKWWERKEVAYRELIDSIYDIVQYCEIEKNDYGDGGNINSGIRKELEINYTKAYWKIKKATALKDYILSSNASLILDDLRKRPILEWNDNPSWEIFESEYEYYAQTLERIIKESHDDLHKK